MKKSTILIILIVILATIIALLFVIHETQVTTKPTFYYPDEPKIANARTVSPWTTPQKPEIISVSTVVPDKKLIAEIWKDNSSLDLPKALNDLKIDQKYYGYFYDNAEIPFNFGKADLNGDGILDDYFTSMGVGCVSCHSPIITIFVNNNVYETNTDGGYLKPRSDKKGFYITDEIRNFKTPYSDPPDAIEIDRFQWNGNGFAEVGVRTITVYKNPITKNQAEEIKEVYPECIAFLCPTYTNLDVTGNHAEDTVIKIPMAMTQGTGKIVIMEKGKKIFDSGVLANIGLEPLADGNGFILSYSSMMDKNLNRTNYQVRYAWENGQFLKQ
jgi:hypothetical protein